MKSYRGIGGMTPRVLILVNRWLVVSPIIWPLYPRERNPVPIEWEAMWALRPVWTRIEKGKSSALTGI
jgi:hypothetical protein